MKLRLIVPLAVAVAAIGMVLAGQRDAEAHAILLRSDPPVNGQLAASPGIVTAFFSEALDERLSSMKVVDGAGEQVDDGNVAFGPEPERMAVSIGHELDPGFYVVIWETLSSVDGHLLKGSYPFTILNPDGTQPSGPKFEAGGTTGSSANPENVAVKWAGIIAATMLVGALAFMAWVSAPALGEVREPYRTQAREAVRRRALRLAWPSVGALVLVAGGELLLQIDQLGGTEYLDEILSNSWGERWIQRQVVLGGIAVALIAAVYLWRAGRAGIAQAAVWVALAGGLGYLLLVAMVGHGNAVPGSFWAVGADFLHLAATAVWVGMLVMLALFWMWMREADLPEDDRTDLEAGHLQRFSTIAASSVIILLATGTVNGLSQIPDIGSLIDTAYGRALAIKLGVMCLLLGVAGLNAFYLRPRTIEEADEERPHEDLRRHLALAIRVEVALALAVIFFAAILIQYPTARQIDEAEANAAAAAKTQAVIGYEVIQPAGDIQINLSISPNSVGQNSYRVFLFPSGSEPLGEVLRVRVRFQPPDSSIGISETEMEPAGQFAYKAVGPFFSQPGSWTVSVDVRRRAVDDARADFPVNVKSPGEKDQFALPLSVGSWLTVTAIVILVASLLMATWATQWPDLPEAAPRFLRVGTAAFSVIGVGLLVLSFLPGEETVVGNPVKPTAESIAMGRDLYDNNCQQCHGPNGDGKGSLAETLPVAPADFRIHVPYHDDTFLFGVISNGLGSIMPSFGDQLTETQRWHLINFLRSEFGNAETPTPVPSP